MGFNRAKMKWEQYCEAKQSGPESFRSVLEHKGNGGNKNWCLTKSGQHRYWGGKHNGVCVNGSSDHIVMIWVPKIRPKEMGGLKMEMM